MKKLLFYPCDARKHHSGQIFFRFRDFSECIFTSKSRTNSYQDIADTLEMLVTKTIVCGENLPLPSSRLEHEFVVEVPLNKPMGGNADGVVENSRTAGNSQI